MGCSASSQQAKYAVAGNLQVDGFLRYTSGTQGWTRTKPASGRRDIHLEVYQADGPLGTWRGNVFVDGVTMDDVMSYVKYKLGADNYELLENDEEEWIFRDLFDFKAANEGLYVHKVAGDHRGETAERMEDSTMTLDPRKTSMGTLQRQKSGSPARPRRDTDMGSIREIDNEDSPMKLTSNGAESDDESGSDSEETKKSSQTVDTTEKLTTRDISGLLQDTHKAQSSGRLSTWHSRLFTNSRNTGYGGGASARYSKDHSEVPAPREMIFKRQDFGLGGSRAVVVAQSVKYNKVKANMVGAKRCTVRMIGALLEEFVERKKPRIKLTFLCSIDPDLAEWETPLATEAALSMLGGKARVESFLLDVLLFFSSPSNRLMQRFRYTAGAGTGELGWEEVERSKNELQLGTNVQHPTHGHGVVQSFDMKGRARVVYDSKLVVDHGPEEKDDLRVTVIIGTRVSHPERGHGTVKAFDETGRIHVKFDNGEMHRYKQEAWKKKMHAVKLMGIGGALGTVRLSWRPFENVREGMGRVKFAVGVSTESVLEYILETNTAQSQDEEKSGTIIERRVVKVLSENERIIYEHRKMPPPLTPRDFVFKEIWAEVAPKTYVVVYESITHPDCPEKPQCVRGETHLSGWLLEPLYLDEEAYDGEDHICRVTFQICIDAKGFIAPESVESVRLAQLLGAYTDCRAYFSQQSQKKANKKLRNRQSKKMSALGSMEGSEKSGAMKKIASKLAM